jgi:hypothetical protein
MEELLTLAIFALALYFVFKDFFARAKPSQSSAQSVSRTASTVKTGSAATPKKQALPEDSILQRHARAQIRAELLAGLPPCPTDAILKRHYQQHVQSLINQHAI